MKSRGLGDVYKRQLSIIAGMFVFIYPLWSAKMLVIFSGAALLVFGVTLIVRAIQFGKLVH